MATKAMSTCADRRHALAGAACVGLLGLGLMLFKPTGQFLAHLSHDLGFLFRPPTLLTNSQAVIVSMDESSRRHFPPHPSGLWDRVHHTQLIQTLDDLGAAAVVFNVWFGDPWPNPAVDEAFARAIREARCKIVLAAHLPDARVNREGRVLIDQPLPAAEPLGSAAAWGVMEQSIDPDGVIRRLDVSLEFPTVAWRAAQLQGLTPETPPREATLNYYGPPQTVPTIPYLSLFEPRAVSENFFRGKTVFVGAGSPAPAHPTPPQPSNLPDPPDATGDDGPVHATPWTRWTGQKLSGVEIQATAFLNLVRKDWLQPVNPWAFLAIITTAGALAGYGLALVRPGTALLAGLHIAFLTALGAALLARAQLSVPWLVLTGLQLPAAIAWSALAGRATLNRATAPSEADFAADPDRVATGANGSARGVASAAVPALAARANGSARLEPGGPMAAPHVADHTLLRCIGRGAYGEIWLARNTVGLHHAVKVVYRNGFEDPAPYEREFNGIKQFMPVSRTHASFVHILHVGRDDGAGYFYYVMEAGDDEAMGQRFDPDRYSPMNLARHVKKLRRMDPVDCVYLGLMLTNGLECLHKQKLIHRDIKPSNIIYVNGRPKFADIGLVTGVGRGTSRDTFIGTPGYIPPEGPGRPTADIYSLGKVLYEAGMGRSRLEFPDVPTTMIDQQAAPGFHELNRVILKACEADVSRRYQSAAEMHADLLKIQIALCSK